MLYPNELAEIDHEIAKFPVRKSACLDALLVVQKFRGYVDDESLKDVAEYLGMSPTELDGIATFYNLIYRKPVGKCVIRLCDSVSCWIMGYEKVKQSIKEELGIDFGQTSHDDQFTLLPAQCLGTCDHAPSMMINNELYEDLTPTKTKEIIRSHQKEEEGHDKTFNRSHELEWSTP